MKLPNKYDYGTLFAFSGIDGENQHVNDLAGILMHKPVTVRFDAKTPVFLSVPLTQAKTDFVLCDVLKCDNLLLLFADQTTVIGKTDAAAVIYAEDGPSDAPEAGVQVIERNGFAYALFQKDGAFAFCRAKTPEEAMRAAKEKIALDIDALCAQRLAYYEQKPPCPRPEYERLYYKCLSVNRVNVYSPQDGIDCRFTTPDRLPHKHMWLWDSMFHAMAFAQYDGEMAKDSIRAVLQCQREDGFLAHRFNSRTDISDITQPQVVAWAVLEVFRKTGDKAFLAQCADRVAAFLLWFAKNRDDNRNGLPEWKTDFSNVRCRCDESGMDNSPRFDTTEKLDAIDCSCFMAHDCRCLAEIYRILGKTEEAARFAALADETAEKINALLWDEARGGYCDRTLAGELTGVLSCCSFLPLFAEICDKEKAAALVRLLQDPDRFGTPLPVPSISVDHPDYGTDMWRGGVWLNFNYFIILGLRHCGYAALAHELKEKTLAAVNRWFEETGNVFEFYDPENKTAPWHLQRKGKQPPVPDYRVRYHSISDFNWSACFTLLMLLDEEDA